MSKNLSLLDFDSALENNIPTILTFTAGVTITCFIVCENLLLLCSILFSRKNLSRSPHLYLLNLICVDLLTGILIIPPLTVIELATENWTTERNLCFYWLIVGSILLNARVFALCGVAIDRYLSICHAMRYSQLLTYSRARYSVLASWVISFLLLLPQLVAFALNNVSCNTFSENISNTALSLDWNCSISLTQRGLLVAMFILRIILPFTAGSVLHLLAFRLLSKSRKLIQDGVLTMKDPTIQCKPSPFPVKKQTNNSNTNSHKTIVMRIHRGNYMTDATKDLFAQLPITSRSQSARSHRRTAVLPHGGLRLRSNEKPLQRVQTLCTNYRIAHPTSDEDYEACKVTTESNIQQPPSEEMLQNNSISRDEEETLTANTTLLRSSPASQSSSKTWWRLYKNRCSISNRRTNHAKIKSLAAIIPLTMLLTCFIVFTLPYHVVQVLYALSVIGTPLLSKVNPTLFWLTSVNSIVNPMILVFWSPAYKAKFLKMITCGRVHQKELAIKRLIIASLGTANLPYGRHITPHSIND